MMKYTPLVRNESAPTPAASNAAASIAAGQVTNAESIPFVSKIPATYPPSARTQRDRS